jgi:flagellin
MNAHRQLTIADGGMSKSLQRLSSGFRINNAADDAAGLSISSNMRAEMASLKVASRNTSQASSMLQVAEGAMDQINNMLTRLKELATQAASANITSSDRTKINSEASKLTTEIDRIADATKYNGTALINGNFGAVASMGAEASAGIASSGSVDVANVVDDTVNYTLADAAGTTVSLTNGTITQTLTGIGTGAQTLNFSALGVKITLDSGYSTSAALAGITFDIGSSTQNIQVGKENDGINRIAIDIGDMQTSALNDGSALSIDLTTADKANSALTDLDTAISYVAGKRGDVGAYMNQLTYAAANLATSLENVAAAESVIRDVDMAAEMTTFTKNQILLQAGTAMLAQANMAPQQVLALFG